MRIKEGYTWDLNSLGELAMNFANSFIGHFSSQVFVISMAF